MTPSDPLTLPLYHSAPGSWQTRWASFENPSAGKGAAATTNRGAKGSAWCCIRPGESKTLLDIEGSGLITRIWATLFDLTFAGKPASMLRALRIDMFWDGAATPAVSAPIGDFFGASLARALPFANQVFSSPEGRSFNCFVPMPFRRSARITVTNEGTDCLKHFFYDVNLLMGVEHPAEALYFHTHWRRESPNVLGEPFTLLPCVTGRGRFLGTHFGVNLDPVYDGAWWGEGEFKAWLDGDERHPTLCGTGEEDYIGTGYCQGPFSHPTQGCTLADGGARQFGMYRFHTVDPVYFHTDFRAVLDTIGGCQAAWVHQKRRAGVPLDPISLSWDGRNPLGPGKSWLWRLKEDGEPDLGDPNLAERWCNFYRCDDWSGAAYFYLDAPENGLPALRPVEERIRDLKLEPPSATSANA